MLRQFLELFGRPIAPLSFGDTLLDQDHNVDPILRNIYSYPAF